jgi:hypothetical protein
VLEVISEQNDQERRALLDQLRTRSSRTAGFGGLICAAIE